MKASSSFSSKFLTAIALLALVFSFLPARTTHAASTGFLSPTSCAGWTAPANALSSNDVRATEGGDNNAIVCTFSIPAIAVGNIINGIQVTVEGSGTISRDVDVDLSWNGGGTFTGGDPIIDLTGTEQVFTVGGTTNTWGRTWAVGDFTAANFRVRVTTDNDTGTASVDHIQVNVHYDLPPEMNVQGNGVSIIDGDATPSATDFTDFGNVPENFSVDRTFTIQNTGSGVLNIGAITFTGGDAGDFSVVTAPAATVAPGGSTTFTVRLTSGGGGTRNATLSIANNDTSENPYNFDLQGTTINAEINVQGLGVNIADGDGTPSLTDCTNFGSVVVLSFIDCTYTIQNQGPAAANVLSVGMVTVGGANAGDFTVTSQPTSPVANGANTTFTVRFTPSAAGARNATLSFINNDGGTESPYNWSIQGTGLANTAPTITSNGGGATATISVSENTTAVTTVVATDPNVPPQTLTYSISGTDAGDFSIVPATGVLTFSPAPNFEASADADLNNSYIVIVQVSDGVNTDTQTITVNVTNVNETPTDMALSNSNINENVAANSTVGTLSTTDPDAANTFTYTLVSGVGDTDNAAFNISGNSLRITASPDYETQSSYSVRVRTTDQGGLFYEEAFTVSINDLNETPTDMALSNSNINENVAANSTVGTLSTTDPDAANTFTYTLVTGVGDTDNAAFNISGNSLRITASPDFETQSSYSVRIRTTDQGGLFHEEAITVTINDLDEIPPDTTIDSSPADPTANNTAAFTFSGTDASGIASFECQIDGGGFSACVSSQNYAALSDGSHTFQVRAIDIVGNVDPTPASFSWTVDTVSPNTTITSNPSDPSNTASPAFAFTGNDGAGTGIASFECQVDGGGFSACTSGSTFGPLSDGSHTFEVRAIDNVGNTDTTPASYTWVVDTTAPDTTITAGPTDPSNDASAAFSFTGTDGGSGVASFECQVDGGGFSACTTGSTFGPFSDGSHTFDVRAIDNAGNVDGSPASYTWLVDTAAPDTSITATPTDPSNNTAAAFSFTGSDGGSGVASFECQLDGGGFSTCASPQNYAGLTDGSHTFQVRAIDTAGNTDSSPASYTWVVDTIAPDTTITANPADPTNNANAAFSFIGSDGGSGVASFECQLDGGGFSACTSPQIYVGLGDGSHTFDVRAVDNANNIDATPASYTWVVDTTSPDTTITSNPSDPSNTANPAFAFTGNDGTGSGVASFECQLDGGGFSACTTGSTFGPLSDGSHTFDVRAIDNANNIDVTPASYTWVVDTTAPDTTITSNPSDPSADNTPAFSFTGSDPGGSGVASFECQLDGGGFSACTSGSTFGPLADGLHTFNVRAIDNAGNPDATPASYTWVVDTAAPDTTITSNPSDPSADNTPAFSFTGSDPGGTGVASFECQVDGGGFAACTSGSTFGPLSDGSHTFQVRALDNVGNTDATPAAYTWVVDTAAPDTTITSNPSNPSADNTPAFAFTGNDFGGSGVALFECQLDGGGFSSCTTGSTFGPLSDGSHTFDVRALDSVGNTDATPASYTWVVDTTAPNTTITSNPSDPSADNTPAFSFTGSDPGGSGVASFECQLDGSGFSACTTGSTFGPLSDGAHTFDVRAIDNAGNTDFTPASFAWVVDTTAPDTTITANPTDPSNSASAAFSFTGTDGGSGVASFECQIDGGGFGACISPQNYTGLVDGAHTFDVRAIDIAGNPDTTPASYTWVVDTTAPDTSITGNPSDPSNTPNPTFAFTGNDGAGTGVASFECQVDGGGFSACASGSVFGPLSDGSHTFDVRAIDNVGNTDAIPASYTWVVDTTAPDTTITANPSDPSSANTPAFSFIGSDPGGSGVALFECQVDGGGFSACTSGSSFGPLTDGLHTFDVRAVDNAGNTDPTPASYTWSVDATVPDTTITSNPADPSNSASASFSFSGSDPGGSGIASFECQLNGSGFSTCTSPQSYTGLTDGSHTFQVRAVDVTGNIDPSPASYTWLVDTTAPDTTITANPADPSNSASAAFSFTGTDGGTGVASFECQLDGGGFSACTSPQNYAGLSDGSHTFDVRAIDNVGNLDASPASFSWTVDTVSPDTTITSNPSDPSADNTPAFAFIGSDPSGTGVASFECQVDGGGFTACTSGSIFGPLTDGSHTFDVRAVDNAGNVDATPASYTWIVDATAPDTTLGTTPANPDNNASPAFTFSSPDPTATFECELDGGGYSACNSGDTFGPLADGSHTFDVRAIDPLGNADATPASYIWTVDTGAPNTNIDSNPVNPSNSANATFTFSSPDADVVGFECQMDGGVFASCTTPVNYAGLSGGSHVFEVRAVDNAGNVDPSPATFTWVVDLGFPTVTGATPANSTVVTTGPILLTVTFSEDVKNDGSTGAANNSINYLLVEDGVNNTFDTLTCAGGLVADDTLIPINSAVYTNNGGSGPFVATVNINGGVVLPVGTYRLFVCGTTSIEDLANNELNNGISDTQVNFVVQAPPASTTVASLLPATGFPQNEVTPLPVQPVALAYAATDMWLEIPKLGVKMSIVGVPQTETGWNVTWLNKDAGWLERSAFPTWNGNSVITGHVWDALNRPGPFANLKSLKYGDLVKVHAFGQVYTFMVTENNLIAPNDSAAVFKHTDKPVITLLTCEEYVEATRTYASRRMVRVVLVSVVKEK